MTDISRIHELVKLCNEASHHYYTLDNPIMTDKQYDKLFDELSMLEKRTNCILSISPTQKVQGEILPFLTKVKHSEPMLSADKSKDVNDIIKFMGDQPCILSWKLDGLTIVLKYNDGKFIQAITRGRGEYGEDVTHTVRTFLNIPLTISYKGYLEIRGEGLVTFEEFNRINEELLLQGEEPFANSRNLASGSVRQLDANVTKSRKLIFKAFGIVNCDDKISRKCLQLHRLGLLGFEVVHYIEINKETLSQSMSWFEDNVKTLPYPTDGLIVEYDNIAYGKLQGFTGHHSKALYAFKWFDDSYETIFRGIETNTTRTGMGSVTALFDTVEIDGTEVSRASVHNVDIFEDFEFGVGDRISVYKANMIIPQIDENLDKTGTYQLNMKCPSCGNDYIIKKPKDTRFLFCNNPNCPAQLIGKLSHFVSREAMNIDGLSEATLEKLIAEGFIKTFSDIYKLEQYKVNIINLEGFGKRSYEKLIEAIEKSKNVDMANFIYSLGIAQIGRSACKTIANFFQYNWEEFDNVILGGFDFTSLDDFGKIMSDNLNGWFKIEDNKKQWFELVYILNINKPQKKSTPNFESLFDKIFVVTGTVTTFKNRNELEDLIICLEGKLSGSVSKNTTFLINNDTTSTSGKNQKAQQLGVPIISEDDFNKMIGREV